MPPDITGTGAAGGVPIPPSAPVRPASPSRAVVPVERVGPRPSADSPLGRSGIDLAELLLSADVLETRDAVVPVALEMGLETARRHLLQRQPALALESLDGIWAGADASEEGWYLRSGALAVLGHAAEAERVASEGLVAQPQSIALRFVQSVARALVGDLSGARAALMLALDSAPNEPVLLAQQAVVLARQGHSDDAAVLIDQLVRETPDHPALSWARGAIRSASADRTRSAAQPAFADEPIDVPPPQDVGAPDGDAVASAFRTLGARLSNDRGDGLHLEVRTLLRACSAGGALASACTPQEAHAARQVLSAISTALQQTRARNNVFGLPRFADSPITATLQPLVEQLLPLLRDGRQGKLAEAERVLRRTGAAVPLPVRVLLDTVLQGSANAVRDVARATPMESRSVVESDGDPSTDGEIRSLATASAAADEIVRGVPGDEDSGPMVPVRLGLMLLSESSATRAFERNQEVISDGSLSGAKSGEWRAGAVDSDGIGGWGGTRAASEIMPRATRPAPAKSAALPAIVLVAGALGAAVNGAGAVAVALGALALWLALRRQPEPPAE